MLHLLLHGLPEINNKMVPDGLLCWLCLAGLRVFLLILCCWAPLLPCPSDVEARLIAMEMVVSGLEDAPSFTDQGVTTSDMSSKPSLMKTLQMYRSSSCS